jgi:hypothetical protein
MKATVILLASAALLFSTYALAAHQAAPAQQAAPAATAPAPAAGSDSGAASSSSDEDMFGSPETVTQADNVSKEAQGQSNFLKYDQVKVGGSFTGKFGFTSAWASPWDGSEPFFPPPSYYITPDIQGDLTIVAKPLVDFGVNMDLRTSWPFTLSSATSTAGALPNISTASLTTPGTGTIPNIAVWSLYSKFNWQDKVYFSVGKQPLAWGVSKGYYQPADDIFAASTAIDPTNTSAEREGPISIKTTIPLGVTNNFYIFAGLPTIIDSTTGAAATTLDPSQARVAVKGEFGFGNTELALAAYYSEKDHPRALLMGTTSIGTWNVFGEGILKFGSERYFLTSGKAPVTPLNPNGISGAQDAAYQLYFNGTAGGFYSNPDSRLIVMIQYYYNGEGQTGVSAKDAYSYFIAESKSGVSQFDNLKYSTHYAFASISDTDLFSAAFGADKLGASLVAIANLSDLSGYLLPSVSWQFFDYMSLQLGATFSFGPSGSEFITYGVGSQGGSGLSTTPGVAVNLTLTVGSGKF